MKTETTLLTADGIVRQVQVKVKDKEDFVSYSMNKAIESGMPAKQIVATFKDMAEDNKGMVVELLGNELTNDILNFK